LPFKEGLRLQLHYSRRHDLTNDAIARALARGRGSRERRNAISIRRSSKRC